MKFSRLLPLAAVLALPLAACSDSTSPARTAQLTVVMTDAPSALLEEAIVTIGAVQILGPGGPPVTLTEHAGTFDLLQLQNGVTALLASVAIEPGLYNQLRLVVESAEVTLSDGHTFNDGTTTRSLHVPSGAQSGIKINLRMADGDAETAGIDISQGETILVVDFDVNQSFVVQGNPDTPAGINSVSFTPLLRAVVTDVAASIEGTISAPAEVSVEDIVVSAELTESTELEELQTAAGTAVTADDGTYRIWFLAPGTYTVTIAAPEGFDSDPESRSVVVAAGQNVTGIDFTLVVSED
jgi:hypothetical protein